MTKSTPPKNIVVYADDDPDDIQLVLDSFSRYSTNVEVLTFRDGLQTLSYLQNISGIDSLPCLIILDINMPRLDGKETLIRIRQIEELVETPVVMFTTSFFPLDPTFAEEYKAGLIKKPLDVRQMELITDQFIEFCTEDIKKRIRGKIR
jgi:CheY-like chemotaxis protein